MLGKVLNLPGNRRAWYVDIRYRQTGLLPGPQRESAAWRRQLGILGSHMSFEMESVLYAS